MPLNKIGLPPDNLFYNAYVKIPCQALPNLDIMPQGIISIYINVLQKKL